MASTYLITTEGLDCWTAYNMIDFADFGGIAKPAIQYTTPFTVSVVKLKALKLSSFGLKTSKEWMSHRVMDTSMMLYCRNIYSYMRSQLLQQRTMLSLLLDQSLIPPIGTHLLMVHRNVLIRSLAI